MRFRYLVLSLALSIGGCSVINSVDEPVASGGGGTTTTNTAGSGGQGTCDPSTCPGTDSDCRVRACDANDACTQADEPAHTPCDEAGGAVCDGAGTCVGCVNEDDCQPGDACDQSTCVPAECIDGSQGQNETDVDCGGGDCVPCANGLTCIVFSDCLSNFCDAQDVCSACLSDADCSSATDSWCDPSVDGGSCVPKKDDGDSCSGGNQCLGGNCPGDDGVCCNQPCDATCEGCLSAKTGQADGTCGLVSAGDDPDGECSDEGVSTCGINGTGCDGSAPACNIYPSGTVCIPADCNGGVETSEGTCDGGGSCLGSNTTDCAPYVCGADGCLTACGFNNDCIPAHHCSGSVCVPNCGPIVSVSSPVDHVTYGTTHGQWMPDPLETLGSGKLWSMDGFDGTEVMRYANLNALIAQNAEQVFNLSVGFNGTGAVVYDGFLYYNRDNTPNMVKYNLASQSQVLDVVLPNAGFHNTYFYQWGGYSDIDFAVDESGLWVIYATAANNGNIVISKLNPANLSITQTWNTSRPKMQTGNAWIACGILYGTASYSANQTTIDFRYDTSTSQSTNPSIPFENPGGYNSMIDYNPTERLLYSWDSGHHLTYQVNF